MKTEDEIDESQKLQLKFEYDVHLLNYTIKLKKNIKKLNWAFEVLGIFLKNPIPQPCSSPLESTSSLTIRQPPSTDFMSFSQESSTVSHHPSSSSPLSSSITPSVFNSVLKTTNLFGFSTNPSHRGKLVQNSGLPLTDSLTCF